MHQQSLAHDGMKLTPAVLSNLYASLACCHPYSRWKMPLPEEVDFVVTDDPVCTWDSKSAACRLGYVESCSDITQQKISEIYDTMLNSHAFD